MNVFDVILIALIVLGVVISIPKIKKNKCKNCTKDCVFKCKKEGK